MVVVEASSSKWRFPKSNVELDFKQWRTKRGEPFAFLTSVVAKHQKIEGGPFGEKKSEKSHNAVKN